MAMVILYENRTNNKIKRSIGCAGNAEEEA